VAAENLLKEGSSVAEGSEIWTWIPAKNSSFRDANPAFSLIVHNFEQRLAWAPGADLDVGKGTVAAIASRNQAASSAKYFRTSQE
jgi:hypothetical protein